MDDWNIIFPMLESGNDDHTIAKALKTLWGGTQDDREQRVAHTRRAFFGVIHNYANSYGKGAANG